MTDHDLLPDDGSDTCLDSLIIDYLDDQLSPADEARLSEHLRQCPQCRDELERQQAWLQHRAAIRSQREAVELPAGLTARLQRSMASELASLGQQSQPDKQPAAPAQPTADLLPGQPEAAVTWPDTPIRQRSGLQRWVSFVRSWRSLASAAAIAVLLLASGVLYQVWTGTNRQLATSLEVGQTVPMTLADAKNGPAGSATEAGSLTEAGMSVAGLDNTANWQFYDGPLSRIPGFACLFDVSRPVTDETISEQTATTAATTAATESAANSEATTEATTAATTAATDTPAGETSTEPSATNRLLTSGVLANAEKVLILCRSANRTPAGGSNLPGDEPAEPQTVLILAAYPCDQVQAVGIPMTRTLANCNPAISVTILDNPIRRQDLQALVGDDLFSRIMAELPQPDRAWISITIGGLGA